MVILRHELRQGRAALAIWTTAVSAMLAVCILIFPEMAADMKVIGSLFANMGVFSAAFGMDKLNFGEFTGFFCVECGNVLGLGGAFYAALTASQMLCKEEKGRTAEFLLTHPVTRTRIVLEKLLAIVVQLVILNGAAAAVTAGSVLAIGEEAPVGTMALLFAGYFLMQLELAAVTFGISAALRRGGAGLGLGIAALCYFLNLAANLTEKARFLKYITPFGYTDGAQIVADGALHAGYLAAGMAYGAAGIAFAFLYYTKKDIA